MSGTPTKSKKQLTHSLTHSLTNSLTHSESHILFDRACKSGGGDVSAGEQRGAGGARVRVVHLQRHVPGQRGAGQAG